MKNRLLVIENDSISDAAEEYFLAISGLGRGKGSSEIYKRGMAALKNIHGRIGIRAVVSEYKGNVVREDCIVLDGERLDSNISRWIDTDSVTGAFAYAITAGTSFCVSENLLDEAFEDIWQTAYLYAGCDILKEMIIEDTVEEKVYLTDSFGPGYFGMGADALGGIFRLLDTGLLGIRLTPEGCISPLKSCTGFFISGTKQLDIPLKDCADCRGSGKMCMYCKSGCRDGGIKEKATAAGV